MPPKLGTSQTEHCASGPHNLAPLTTCHPSARAGLGAGATDAETVPADPGADTGGLPSLPPELIRHHLAPHLAPSALRMLRLASRATATDIAASAITVLRRPPGTHPLAPDLGTRFPRLTRLDLSGDTQLSGGLALFRALKSVGTSLVSLSLAGCTDLPASFVARQLPAACPQLQHLSLSCCCTAPPDTEAALLAALAAAPLAANLTSLELHCGPSFQPEIAHLGPPPAGAGAGGSSGGLGRRLRSLRLLGSRTLCDSALAALPALAPALEDLALGEQHSRRGLHVRGGGLAALGALAGLRSLTLGCAQPDPWVAAAALATLTQLTELDLSRCDPGLAEALAPLARLLRSDDAGCGGGLRRLQLPTAYTPRQLTQGVLPALSGGAAAGGGGDAGGPGTAGGAASLRALRLHASAALPAALAATLATGLTGLRDLDLSYCGPSGLTPAAVAAAATALARLTSLRLVQESSAGLLDIDEPAAAVVGGDAPVEVNRAGAASAVVGGAENAVAPAPPLWYDAIPAWTALQRLVLADANTLCDRHLYDMGRTLSGLSYLRVSGGGGGDLDGTGFESWRLHCRRLTSVSLYDCANVSDAAVAHLAALPLRALTLAHLPAVSADGVRHLAAHCTTLRSLTLERLAGAPGAALAALWRLPLLESLALRMCDVNNLTLEMAMGAGGGGGASPAAPPPSPADAAATPPAAAPQADPQGSSACAGGDDAAAEPPPPAPSDAAAAPSPVLSWLDLQGTLVSTAGLRALRGVARSLTHLDVSNCASVGDGVGDLLLLGGGGGAGASGAAASCGGGGASRANQMLLPALVHVDVRGCPVAESTLARLRDAGLAVNVGGGVWR